MAARQGLAAAVAARESGIQDVLILEREPELGGILNQCIHSGFGLHTFQEELTGPEYAARFIEKGPPSWRFPTGFPPRWWICSARGTACWSPASAGSGAFQVVEAGAVDAGHGLPGAAPWGAEHPRLPGPAGIFSAGTAQRLVNLEGYLPGREVVILGSGDIGLIMARRMTLEGRQGQGAWRS